MRNRLEIGDDFRLIPSGTEVYNGGNTIIKVLEDTIIAKIFYKEQAASEEKKELAYSLAGKINIIVDTILVTKKGAVGKSIDKVVSTAAMKATDFVDFESLDKAPEQLIDEKLAQITGVIPDIMTSTSCHDVKIDFGDWHDRRNTCILYAPAEEKHGYFILVVSKKKIVVVDEPHVYVVGKKEYVSVTDEGVEVTKKSGKSIFINSGFPNRIISEVFNSIREGSHDIDLDFD